MDVACCTLDDVIYQAVRFAALPPNELAKKRRFLECTGCHALAFFRKASRSGQAACFGARPHEKDCTLAASEYEQNNIGIGDDQDIIENPGRRIIIDFNFGAPDDRHNDPDAPVNAGGRGGRFIGNVRPDAAMHRSPSTILRDLIVSKQFRTSRQIVEIAGVGKFTVANFFVRFGAVAAMHDNQYRGYWGMIVSARFGKTGALWLNSGGRDDMSVCVPKQFVNELYKRFRITDKDELVDAYALVFGTLHALQDRKRYVRVEDLGFITLRQIRN